LEETLAQPYRFEVIPDEEDGGFVIIFPDLPGCMTQVETLAEVADAAEEIRLLWLETEFERAKFEEQTIRSSR
jgi:predicted RNase H-like HicB family nuclease